MPIGLDFFRSRQWAVTRRLILVGIVILVAIRQYGGQITTLLRHPDPVNDIAITRAEFRPELPGTKPAWIIELHNNSQKFTYDQIQVEAKYIDDSGNVVETDKLVIMQKLAPGDDKLVGSVDFKSRGAAKRGTLRVMSATTVAVR
jgi:hypothetical protein